MVKLAEGLFQLFVFYLGCYALGKEFVEFVDTVFYHIINILETSILDLKLLMNPKILSLNKEISIHYIKITQFKVRAEFLICF